MLKKFAYFIYENHIQVGILSYSEMYGFRKKAEQTIPLSCPIDTMKIYEELGQEYCIIKDEEIEKGYYY